MLAKKKRTVEKVLDACGVGDIRVFVSACVYPRRIMLCRLAGWQAQGEDKVKRVQGDR